MSEAAATAAMSAGSMEAAGRNANGRVISELRRICGAHCKGLDMNRPVRSSVHVISLPVTASSTWRDQSARTSPPSAPLETDSSTTWWTPARSAACARRGRWVGRCAAPGTSADIRKARSTPSKAAVRPVGSSASPATACTRGPAIYRSGRRVIARTSCPASASCATSSAPTWPVAPVTRIVMASLHERGTSGPFPAGRLGGQGGSGQPSRCLADDEEAGEPADRDQPGGGFGDQVEGREQACGCGGERNVGERGGEQPRAASGQPDSADEQAVADAVRHTTGQERAAMHREGAEVVVGAVSGEQRGVGGGGGERRGGRGAAREGAHLQPLPGRFRSACQTCCRGGEAPQGDRGDELPGDTEPRGAGIGAEELADSVRRGARTWIGHAGPEGGSDDPGQERGGGGDAGQRSAGRAGGHGCAFRCGGPSGRPRGASEWLARCSPQDLRAGGGGGADQRGSRGGCQEEGDG